MSRTLICAGVSAIAIGVSGCGGGAPSGYSAFNPAPIMQSNPGFNQSPAVERPIDIIATKRKYERIFLEPDETVRAHLRAREYQKMLLEGQQNFERATQMYMHMPW